MIDVLAQNLLLLLFLVAAFGYFLGHVKIGGFQLGIAAVLFVGLAFGALDPRLKLPEFLYALGLVLFVYTVGLAGGPSFFGSLRRQGLRNNGLTLGMLLIATTLVVAAHLMLGFAPAVSAGLFAGSLTNTPALAAAVEALERSGADATILSQPVVAYSVAYPMGVIGVILAIFVLQRYWRVDYAQETRELRDLGASGEHLENVTAMVTSVDIQQKTVDAWRHERGWHIIFGRYQRDGVTSLVHGDTVLEPGDLVSLIGTREDIVLVASCLGAFSDKHLEFDRRELDFRRVFVSNPEVAGKQLAELQLPARFGALITRVRRGDLDLLPTGSTRLELGDRVRVVARRDRMPELGRFFGDSYRALSEIDITALGLGITLGLMLGLVTVPLPGGGSFRLGFAGGPLLVALTLGALGRTGPLVWQLPYSASLTLRQLGLTLFLAVIGTRSGEAFVSTLQTETGLHLFLAGTTITCLTACLTLLVGYKLLHIPMSLLIGMVAGLQTQPAVLGYANEQTGNDLGNLGYATVFPLATISKILIVQLLLIVLPGLEG